MIDKPLDTAVVLSFAEFSGKCLLLYHRPKKRTITCNEYHTLHTLLLSSDSNIPLKVALGVCFALKFVERRFTSFHVFNYLMLRCNFSANYKI